MTLAEAVPGRLEDHAAGCCYVADVRRAAADEHAGEVLGEAQAVRRSDVDALAGDGPGAEFDLGRAAYLDTETTGLAGGTGTYAFLIGAGRFVGDSFVVRQFFMRDPADEAGQLEAVAAWLEGSSGLVTFNGRAFDVPLLTMRFGLHLRPMSLDEMPHLDLLPVARRLWRRRLVGCGLANLEREVLGLERVEDVPGWLVPERYFRFQQNGDARPLVGVFEHNAIDVLSMVSLAVRMARSVQTPEAQVEHPLDWMSLARIYQSRGWLERSMAAWEEALVRPATPQLAQEARWALSMTAKRLGLWDRAVAVWKAMMAPGVPHRLGPHVEMAKHLEHRCGDFAAALEYAAAARVLVADGVLERHRRRIALDELDHRIRRLERRRSRQAAAQGATKRPRRRSRRGQIE